MSGGGSQLSGRIPRLGWRVESVRCRWACPPPAQLAAGTRLSEERLGAGSAWVAVPSSWLWGCLAGAFQLKPQAGVLTSAVVIAFLTSVPLNSAVLTRGWVEGSSLSLAAPGTFAVCGVSLGAGEGVS